MNKTHMKRLAIVLILTAGLCAHAVYAEVGLIVSAANLLDECGNPAPAGSIALLVADTGGNGFATDFLSTDSPLSPGSYLSGDDRIIAKWDLSSLGKPGQLLNTTNILLRSGLSTDQALALYWFPSLTMESTTVGLARFGIYTNSTVTYTGSDVIDGGDLWKIPSDGSVAELHFYARNRGGSSPSANSFAFHGFLEPPYACGAGTISIGTIDTNAVISFSTIPIATYDVQMKTDLLAETWSTIASNWAGTGDCLTNIDIGAASDSQRFYRVKFHY